MRHSSVLCALPLTLLLATGQASAHAMLGHTEPRVGNKVAATPR